MGAGGGMRGFGRTALSPKLPATDAFDARFKYMPSAVVILGTRKVPLVHAFALRVTMVACVR